jgi:putative DNA primase/helicase
MSLPEAEGRWFDILSRYIDKGVLTNKHKPCPLCKGKDRFRWDDKDGNGGYFCSHCGSGSGLHLLAQHQGISHKEAAKLVYSLLPQTVQSKPQPSIDKRARVVKLWTKRELLTDNDDVTRYLHGRGIQTIPPAIRRVRHGVFVGNVWQPYIAMIAKAVKGNRAVGVHLTYLADGAKADVTKQKVMYAVEDGALNGAAVRLYDAGETLIIAEGIETALSAAEIFNLPAWAAMTAGLLERVIVPKFVKRVIVCGDNDSNFVGQAAAYALAKRMVDEGRTASVEIPQAGDWNDYWQEAGPGLRKLIARKG